MKSIGKKDVNFVEMTIDMIQLAINKSTAADTGVSDESFNDDRAFLCMYTLKGL